MRRSTLALFVAALLIAAMPASDESASAAAAASLPDLTSFALMRTGAGTPAAVTVEQAADALSAYDVIFLGEWHDHTGNHLAEMALLRAMQARAPGLALSLEQFERDVQPVLDDYLAGRIGEDALTRRGRAWSNYAEAYRPLVEYAKEHGLAVIAAGPPGSVVRCVGQDGPEFLAHMKPEQRGWAAAELHLDDGPYKDKFLRFLREDGAHGQEATAAASAAERSAAELRSFAAQVTRDDTMAESILLHLQKHQGAKVIHVTGAFHVAGGLGTVERLKMRAPGLKIALVVPVEAEGPDFSAFDASEAKNADFVFLLRGLPKEYVSEAERNAAQAGQQRNFRTRSACSL